MARMTTLAPTLGTDAATYLPIILIIMAAVGFAVANVVVSAILGPSRKGERKGMTYESGMAPIGTARKRFNVRFYLIAMTFLLFDVEIIFLYPWAVTFPHLQAKGADGFIWLVRIGFFLLTTLVMYLYGRRKGVFKFD